jgi:hypothetical protein
MIANHGWKPVWRKSSSGGRLRPNRRRKQHRHLHNAPLSSRVKHSRSGVSTTPRLVSHVPAWQWNTILGQRYKSMETLVWSSLESFAPPSAGSKKDHSHTTFSLEFWRRHSKTRCQLHELSFGNLINTPDMPRSHLRRCSVPKALRGLLPMPPRAKHRWNKV